MSKNQNDLRREVSEWFRKRKASAEALQALENSIHDFERSYLAEKFGKNNSFYEGYEPPLTQKQNQKKNSSVKEENVVVKDEHFIFSRSSATSRVHKKTENQKSAGKASETSDDNQSTESPPRLSKRRKA